MKRIKKCFHGLYTLGRGEMNKKRGEGTFSGKVLKPQFPQNLISFFCLLLKV
jgi:hypothetical protein